MGESTLQEQPAEVLIVGPAAEGADLSSQPGAEDVFDRFMESAQGLVERLRQRDEELSRLFRITERINYGVMLEEILEFIYREIRQVIPYNRIGFSLIDEPRGMVAARWAHSDRPMQLGKGYEAPLAGSTLNRILQTGRPRIINDLEGYLRSNPQSESTRLIAGEGMRSSLTCPLIVQGKPVGFLFFSSDATATYSRAHIAFFQQIAGQLSLIVEKGRLYTELADQKATIERQNRMRTQDLEMARQVQRVMIPRQAPQVPGLDIAFDYQPVIQVGGDVLDILPVRDGRVVMFVGDAMGHGVQAALVMSVVKTALQTAVAADAAPHQVLGYLNRAICGLLGECFVTGVCCLLDVPAGSVEVALAGHASPLVFRGGSGQVEALGKAGLPLGVSEAAAFESQRAAMAKGDCLVAFTDGIVEARDAGGELYDDPRLAALVRSQGSNSAAQLVAGIVQDVRAHCGLAAPTDDFTLLVAKIL